MKKGDIICRDLHALQLTDIQAFIDRLSIVERHRVCRGLNRGSHIYVNPYGRKYLQTKFTAYDIETFGRLY